MIEPEAASGDRMEVAAARPKRSRLVLGVLIGMPIGIAVWVVVLWEIALRAGGGGKSNSTSDGLFHVGSASVYHLYVAAAGVALGFVVIGAVAVLYGFSLRIPRTSRWIASTLAASWLAAATILGYRLWMDLPAFLAQLDS